MANECKFSPQDYEDDLQALRDEVRNELAEVKAALERREQAARTAQDSGETSAAISERRRDLEEIKNAIEHCCHFDDSRDRRPDRSTSDSSGKKDLVSKGAIVLLILVATLAGWLYPQITGRELPPEIAGLVDDLKRLTERSDQLLAQRPPAAAVAIDDGNPPELADDNQHSYREERFTVLRPVRETVMRDETYTVTKPVTETVMREEKHTVRKPIRETVMEDEEYTVKRPVKETSWREESYTETRPVQETSVHEERVIVRKAVYETVFRDEQTTIMEPTTNWVPVCRPNEFERWVWTYTPVTTYVPRTVTRRVPTQVVRYHDAVEVRKVPVQSIRYVEERKVRKVPVETIRYVEETKVHKVPVERTRYVDEEEVREVPVEVVRYVEEERTRQVPTEVTRYVEEERVRLVPVPTADHAQIDSKSAGGS